MAGTFRAGVQVNPLHSMAYRIAHVVGMVVNPLVLPPIFFAWLLTCVGWPVSDVIRATTIAGFFLALIPFLALLWMIRSGRVETIEVRTRAHRSGPFIMALVTTLGALGASVLADWPAGPLVEAIFVCHVLNTVLLFGINARFKISLHAASVGGFAAMLAYLFHLAGLDPVSAWPAIMLVPLVGWARVRTGAHTRAEVAAGAAFGLIVPVLELMALHRLSPLGVG